MRRGSVVLCEYFACRSVNAQYNSAGQFKPTLSLLIKADLIRSKYCGQGCLLSILMKMHGTSGYWQAARGAQLVQAQLSLYLFLSQLFIVFPAYFPLSFPSCKTPNLFSACSGAEKHSPFGLLSLHFCVHFGCIEFLPPSEAQPSSLESCNVRHSRSPDNGARDLIGRGDGGQWSCKGEWGRTGSD